MNTANILRRIAVAVSIFATFSVSAGDNHQHKPLEKGPNGGHLTDAANLHLELVNKGKDLVLYVRDLKDAPVDTAGASATADVIVMGAKRLVEMTAAGGNTLKGSGDFTPHPQMKVIVRLRMPGKGPIQAKFMPLAADAPASAHKH